MSVAATRHGVAGVDGEVQERLLDLPGVRLDARDLAPRATARQVMSSPMTRSSIPWMLRTTVLSDRTGGDSTCLRLNASSCWVRPAARSAAAEIASALRRSSVPVRQRLEQAAGLTADDHQQVVEVVGDAAGQPADRLHLLRLTELLLELLVRSEVVELSTNRRQMPALVEEARRADQHVDRRPFLAAKRHLVLAHSSIAGHVAGEPAPVHVAAENRRCPPGHGLRDAGVAEHSRERRIAIGQRPVDGGDEVAGKVGVEELARLAHQPGLVDGVTERPDDERRLRFPFHELVLRMLQEQRRRQAGVHERPQHDDGGCRRGSRDGCQRCKSVAVREPQVQQDDVHTLAREAFEGGSERGFMRHDVPGGRGGDGLGDEARIGKVVLDHENGDGVLHHCGVGNGRRERGRLYQRIGLLSEATCATTRIDTPRLRDAPHLAIVRKCSERILPFRPPVPGGRGLRGARCGDARWRATGAATRAIRRRR